MGIKYPVNEAFFSEWSREMAYVLGYIYADGALVYDPVSRGSYVSISSTDENILIAIKKILASEHTIRKEAAYGNRKAKFTLRIGNAVLYKSLVAHGLYQNKSLTITFPDVPRNYFFDFVRGYFDGDGCVHLSRSKGKTRPLILKRLLVVFTSGSKKFLEGLSRNLSELSDINGHLYRSQRAFQLRFFTQESMILFSEMYDNLHPTLFLSRKREVFNYYFTLRTKRIDEKAKIVLESFR